MENKIDFKDAKPGMYAYVDGESSFCEGGYELITDIKTKYNEDTGEPYKVIVTEDGTYRGDNGYAITAPSAYSIYFITDKIPEELDED